MSDSTRLSANGDGTWTSLGTITICNVAYGLLFDRGGCEGPCLTYYPVGVSGATVRTAVRGGCGCNYIDFAIGDDAVCTGTRACGGPCANLVIIRVSWVPCEWTGDGWYCVRPCGSDGAGTAVYLSAADMADVDFDIVSGPFASERDATCTPGPTSCDDPSGLVAVGDFVRRTSTLSLDEWWHVPIVAGHTYRFRFYLNAPTGAMQVTTNLGRVVATASGSGGGPEAPLCVDVGLTLDGETSFCIRFLINSGYYGFVIEEAVCP